MMTTDDAVLTHEACRAVVDRIVAMTSGGGQTTVLVDSAHCRSMRWARNAIYSGGETQQTDFTVCRSIRGSWGVARTNTFDDAALRRCVEYAESLAPFFEENPETDLNAPAPAPPHLAPILWFDTTQQVDDAAHAHAAAGGIERAAREQFLSTGYVQTAMQGQAVCNTDGLFRYYPYTTAQYSVTVRDRENTASGWAGVDFQDWSRIDTAHLAQVALDKCRRSRHPVMIEPGRYTTLLEPQAVCDLLAPVVETALSREAAEMGLGPFADPDRPGCSRLGQQVLDARITVRADPLDPDGGFVPFDGSGEPYEPVNWIEHGILKALSYNRSYGVRQLMQDHALPNSGAFRMSGGTTTIEEMIANTRRGILVTRFNHVRILDLSSMLLSGNTRDGLWLIEDGRVTKALKNLRFTESPVFALNNVEALGMPQRVFRPNVPAVVPPVLVRDFSFTGAIDAV